MLTRGTCLPKLKNIRKWILSFHKHKYGASLYKFYRGWRFYMIWRSSIEISRVPMSFLTKMVRPNLGILMCLSLSNRCVKHKREHLTMQAHKSGKTKHMIRNQIFGLCGVYFMRPLPLSLHSGLTTWRAFSRKLWGDFIRICLLTTPTIWQSW